LNIKEHQKIRKYYKKRPKVRTRWIVYFCKWWRHTRKTNKEKGYWSVEWGCWEMDFFLHLYSNWQDFNWRSASRSSSAI